MKNEIGRGEMTAILKQIETRTDNPSVMLRMTAPFAQGSHGLEAPLRRQASLHKGAMGMGPPLAIPLHKGAMY